ncbi:SLBB domain-containing protein, partial [Poseidonibacter sp.]|uniref:SLBB domain-containing protein n=1 Tax=Poseidonibacter sp. TaxID=2321188 RepID=UPI003C709376
DIINLSGGFTKKALYSRFEIARYKIKNSKRIRTIKTMNVNDALNQNIKINADDEITIFPIANWYEKIYVTIDGRVRFPGTYAIEEGEKLASIIERAGGFLDNAFIEGAVFTREEIRIVQQKRLEQSLEKLQTQVTQDALNVDEAGSDKDEKLKMLSTVKLLEKEAKKNTPMGRISLSLYHDIKRFKESPYNITLKDKDKLYIPSVNDTVSVLGEVLNQNTFVYEKDLDTNDYLSKAGGITDVADEDYIYIVKANGETKKFKGSYFFGGGNEIFKGDTIVVPLKVDTFSDMRFAKDVSTILYQFAVTAASLKTVGGI